MVVKNTNRYPLDFDALEKGDRISVEDQEKIFGIDRDHPKFWSRSLNLKTKIEKQLANRIPNPLVVTVYHNHWVIVIADDETAAPKSRRGTGLGFKKARRYHRKALGVDLTKLSEEERKKHERGILVQGALLSAVRKRRAELQLTASKRQTPGVLELAGPEKGNGEGGEEKEKEKEKKE